MTETIETLMANTTETAPVTSGAVEAEIALAELALLKKMKKDIEDKISSTEAQIKAFMLVNGCEKLDNGVHSATLSHVERSSFDSKTFKAEHPRLYNRYARTQSYYTLRVK